MASYLIKINSTTVSKLSKYEVEYNRLSADAGRSMQGDLRKTDLGVYPKITLGFTYTTQAEITAIMALINLSQFSVEWWHAQSATYKTGTFYSSNFKVGIFKKVEQVYKDFEVNLISYSKMV